MIEPYIYTFKDLSIFPGLIASGKAELIYAGEHYPDRFYVKDISFGDDGEWTSRDAYSLEWKLAHLVKDIIQDDKTTHGKHAAKEWAEHEKEISA